MRSYTIPRNRVMLVKESETPGGDARINDSQAAYRLLDPLFDGLDREHFMVVAHDAKHAVIASTPRAWDRSP